MFIQIEVRVIAVLTYFVHKNYRGRDDSTVTKGIYSLSCLIMVLTRLSSDWRAHIDLTSPSSYMPFPIHISERPLIFLGQ